MRQEIQARSNLKSTTMVRQSIVRFLNLHKQILPGKNEYFYQNLNAQNEDASLKIPGYFKSKRRRDIQISLYNLLFTNSSYTLLNSGQF